MEEKRVTSEQNLLLFFFLRRLRKTIQEELDWTFKVLKQKYPVNSLDFFMKKVFDTRSQFLAAVPALPESMWHEQNPTV